jgi:long-chain acyl-CoA synthetase
MNFLEIIFANLERTPGKVILSEVHANRLAQQTCRELLTAIGRARSALKQAGLNGGDRCVLLGPNSSRWVAADLAIMAEGGIVVPFYSRQAPGELVAMMKDCTPTLLVCANAELRQSITSISPAPPRTLLYDELFSGDSDHPIEPLRLSNDSPVTIIYTSGTSGNAKGVVLNAGNVSFMVQRTRARLEELMSTVVKANDDRVFHYLPFCFAGSWMLLLTCLYRSNALMMSTHLERLADELKIAKPHYFLNVPALLDRIRNRVLGQLQKKGGLALALFERGQAAWLRRRGCNRHPLDRLFLALAEALVFHKIKQQLGPNLRTLICGSAPLAEETQLFFEMIGIPVLQVYGLTETTAICTMDDVDDHTPGRVGPAIPGIEMKLGNQDEILVRGPNVFQGYWSRPQATAEVVKDGWLHTGDQGHVDEKGNWKIVGRLKDLIIPTSGHNISPEPIEQMILSVLPETEQAMVVGNGRKFLSVIVTGKVPAERISAALAKVNQALPHYKQVRKFHLSPEAFTVENGFLTANRKMKRTLIEARYRKEIDGLYQVNPQP